jgi:putative hydrolase of the HAD superfamily
MAIEFVYFDLGNVLIHFDHPRAARQMAEVAGVSEEQAWEAVFADGLSMRYEQGELTTRQFYEAFCQRTGAAADFDAVVNAVSDIFEVNEPVLPIVAGLRAAGLRLGILSNTNEAHWDFVLRNYPFVDELFDVYALSFQLRSLKPQRRIYEEAARLSDAPAEVTFFTDDREENIEGARAAGFHACHFVTAEKLAADLRERRLLP